MFEMGYRAYTRLWPNAVWFHQDDARDDAEAIESVTKHMANSPMDDKVWLVRTLGPWHNPTHEEFIQVIYGGLPWPRPK